MTYAVTRRSIPAAPQPSVRDDLMGPVRHIMSTPVVFVDADATLRVVTAAMAQEEVGAVVLIGPDGPSRMVTERDVVMALARGADPDALWAAEIASQNLVAAGPEDRVLEVARAMVHHNIRHVPVRRGAEIAGMVSARDVLRAVAGG